MAYENKKKQQQEEKESKTPAVKFRAGLIQVAGWNSTVKSADGREYNTLNFSIQRSYKDKDGEWQNTGSFRRSDLLVLSEVLREAYMKTRLDSDDSEE